MNECSGTRKLRWDHLKKMFPTNTQKWSPSVIGVPLFFIFIFLLDTLVEEFFPTQPSLQGRSQKSPNRIKAEEQEKGKGQSQSCRWQRGGSRWPRSVNWPLWGGRLLIGAWVEFCGNKTSKHWTICFLHLASLLAVVSYPKPWKFPKIHLWEFCDHQVSRSNVSGSDSCGWGLQSQVYMQHQKNLKLWIFHWNFHNLCHVVFYSVIAWIRSC